MTELDLEYIKNLIAEDLETCLKKIGVYYRIVSRTKSMHSIEKKMAAKQESYARNEDKMQDIIGIRLILYFFDDVEIVASIIREHFDCIKQSESNSIDDIKKYANLPEEIKRKIKIDDLEDKVFMPTRLNLVARINGKYQESFKAEIESTLPKYKDYVDTTYEIQIRTILSEGWHEVEHDLRYKTRNEKWWGSCAEESRMLNGVMATLETSERAMNNIFANIAYKNYKSGEWSAMVRNHIRLRTQDLALSNDVEGVFADNKTLAKAFLKFNRGKIMKALHTIKSKYPLTLDNIVFLFNRLGEHNEILLQLEPMAIKKALDTSFNSGEKSEIGIGK